MTEELLAGAVKALRNAIHPLIHEQPVWDGYRALYGDSLYKRLQEAKTAGSVTTGAPMQTSKPPARIDVMAWFVAIDSTVAEFPGPAGTTVFKLSHYYHRIWNPDELRFVKAATRACEGWVESAKQLLGDNPPAVPLRRPCPLCSQMWHRDRDGNQQWALKVTASLDDWHSQCLACKTVWASEAEQALFRRMLEE